MTATSRDMLAQIRREAAKIKPLVILEKIEELRARRSLGGLGDIHPVDHLDERIAPKVDCSLVPFREHTDKQLQDQVAGEFFAGTPLNSPDPTVAHDASKLNESRDESKSRSRL